MNKENIKIVLNLYSAYKGEDKYYYEYKVNNTLWNCEKVENDICYMYTVNSWGKIFNMQIPLSEFDKNFNRIHPDI